MSIPRQDAENVEPDEGKLQGPTEIDDSLPKILLNLLVKLK